MACDDPTLDAAITAVSAALVTSASGPAEATVDGATVRQQPIRDLIEADRYLRSKCAASGPNFGLRFTKLIAPGSV